MATRTVDFSTWNPCYFPVNIMKKHKTKLGRSPFKEALDVLVTPEMAKAIRKSAEDQGESISVLVRRTLKEWLMEKGYLPKIEPPILPYATKRR